MAYPHQDLRFGSPESDMMMREDTFESLQNNECVSPPPSDSFPDEYDVGGVRYLVPPRYSHLAYVGAGSFGNVCKAQDALVKGWVAIKKLPWRAPGRTTPEQHWRYLLREAELLVHFRLAQAWEVAGMENIIVHAHAHDALYFVMPLMACSLRDAFEVNPQDFASHSNVMGIMHNLVCDRYLFLANCVSIHYLHTPTHSSLACTACSLPVSSTVTSSPTTCSSMRTTFSTSETSVRRVASRRARTRRSPGTR